MSRKQDAVLEKLDAILTLLLSENDRLQDENEELRRKLEIARAANKQLNDERNDWMVPKIDWAPSPIVCCYDDYSPSV